VVSGGLPGREQHEHIGDVPLEGGMF